LNHFFFLILGVIFILQRINLALALALALPLPLPLPLLQ
jgi:hypothetical protein